MYVLGNTKEKIKYWITQQITYPEMDPLCLNLTQMHWRTVIGRRDKGYLDCKVQTFLFHLSCKNDYNDAIYKTNCNPNSNFNVGQLQFIYLILLQE